jgi:tRNA/rRNA methyltransferase
MMSLKIILVNPQLPENVGAVARVMSNFGLTHLCLVAPQMLWPNERAITLSAGAGLVLEQAEVVSILAEALQGIHYVAATTSRHREFLKPVLTPKEVAYKMVSLQKNEEECALIFGPERTGLINDDLILAHDLISIPVNPDFPSLNLAQAVNLLAYEYFQINQSDIKFLPQEKKATFQERDYFFKRLEKELEAGGFFEVEEKRTLMVQKIRNLFDRAELHTVEIQILHGIVTALIKYKNNKK